jgi:queuine tRNA-ribosyltransferase
VRLTDVKFPIYLPDATRAVTKTLDSTDLKNTHIEGIVVNTLHLAETPGLDLLDKVGGVKKFMNFDGFVTSDSGGWQVFSLIHRSSNKGAITNEGVSFSVGTGNKQIFTPEQSIRTQLAIGSDLIVCLDDFTPPSASDEKISETVNRTVLWAKRSKLEFEKQTEGLKNKPALLAVIQGGWSKTARRECAERLLEIGFDAFGYGGYVVDNSGWLDMEISQYIAELIPAEKVKFSLGTGKPWEIVQLRQYGWDIFDCTLPTRDARHQRLYVFNQEPNKLSEMLNKQLYGYLDIGKSSFRSDLAPIDPTCDCHTCKNFTRSYVHHLFKIKDAAALRLATIHNLRHYTSIIELLRKFEAQNAI